jgi:hypothetical protein
MVLTEDQTAKIILIRSIEESDRNVFSDRVLDEALAVAKNEEPGLDWIAARANYLFDRLSDWHRSILQLAKVPANWTLPVALLALVLGFATNLLGPTEKIHVVRNPVFVLIAWNLLVYFGLLLILLMNRIRSRSQSFRRSKSSAPEPDKGSAQKFPEPTGIPWTVRYFLPRLWQFVHKIMFGFDQARTLGKLTGSFTVHWLSIAAPLVIARWRYLLQIAAVCMATAAVVGMYLRGLVQGYEFTWTSTFITNEQTVSTVINILFAPSFLVSNLLNLGLAERIDVARLMSPEGDKSEGWIHLFAITVAICVAIPRGVLAVIQKNTIRRHVRGFGLALDKYYGEVIEAPVREIIEKETASATTRFAEDIALYVGQRLYDEQIVPKLREFRENGGRISDLKKSLADITETFSQEVKTYIATNALPGFQDTLSQRVGELIKSIGTDFVNSRDPEAVLTDLKVDMPKDAEIGLGDRFSTAVGVSVGAAISLAFATVAGGIGEELGIAIVAALLGTTGPVGFLIGLIAGAVVAAGAWWFGKDKITEAIENVNLPAMAVRAALWESRFKTLIDDGRRKCEESVKEKINEKLRPTVPMITDQIVFRIRSLWRS